MDENNLNFGQGRGLGRGGGRGRNNGASFGIGWILCLRQMRKKKFPPTRSKMHHNKMSGMWAHDD